MSGKKPEKRSAEPQNAGPSVVPKGPRLSDIEPTPEELEEYRELEAWAERSVKSTSKLVLGEPERRLRA
jgi:hypothetical protein